MIEHAHIRVDQYPISVEEWQWIEGWNHWLQYFPRFFTTSGTIHIFFRNPGNRPLKLQKLLINGSPIEELATNNQFAGPVIWHRLNPEVIPPGKTGMAYIRLRNLPEKPLEITLAGLDGQTMTTILKPTDVEQLRLSYVGFNSNMDRLYAYIDKLVDEQLEIDRIYLDGHESGHREQFVNRNFTDGPVAMAEIRLEKPLQYGNYHTLKIIARGKELTAVAIHQIRIRDDRFFIGMITINSEQTPWQKYWAKFFNCVYWMHGSHPAESGWWDPESEYAGLGFTRIQPAPEESAIKAGGSVPPGRIVYTNVDEPDARVDFRASSLPLQDRPGAGIMQVVEPVMQRQRRLDPRHQTAVLVNRTFAPRNWLEWGEVPDLLISDLYVPTQFHGHDMQAYHYTMKAMNAAVGPRPVFQTLWATMNTGQQMRRSLTPEEIDMAAHYLIGGGVKGLFYFLDWNSYPTVFEGGYYVGTPRTNMLWKQMGRLHAQFTRISRLLAIGHPYNAVSTDHPQVWTGSLLCGSDHLVIILVNRNHRIPSETFKRGFLPPHIHPARNAEILIKPPLELNEGKAYHVTWDRITPLKLTRNDQQELKLTLDELTTSMLIVLSKDPEIIDNMNLPPEQLEALRQSEKPVYTAVNPPIQDADRPYAKIKLEPAALSNPQLDLDLTDPDILAQAALIKCEGELYLNPGQWLGLFPPVDRHGEAELLFRITSSYPLHNLKASLTGETPNFTACAHNIIGISEDGMNYKEESSLKVDWDGGIHGEQLTAEINGETEVNTVYIRICMRDPGIVNSDQATNLVKKIQISWQSLK